MTRVPYVVASSMGFSLFYEQILQGVVLKFLEFLVVWSLILKFLGRLWGDLR